MFDNVIRALDKSVLCFRKSFYAEMSRNVLRHAGLLAVITSIACDGLTNLDHSGQALKGWATSSRTPHHLFRSLMDTYPAAGQRRDGVAAAGPPLARRRTKTDTRDLPGPLLTVMGRRLPEGPGGTLHFPYTRSGSCPLHPRTNHAESAETGANPSPYIS